MNALSCQAASIPLFLRRATATLAVPTSRPMGLVARSRSSIRCSTSSATFHRWSFGCSMLLPSAFIGCGQPLRPAGGGVRLALRLFGCPAVEELLPLAAHVVEAAALPSRLFGQDPLRVAHARPRLAEDLDEVLVVTETEDGHARREPIVLVRQPERLEREAPRPVHVVPDEALLRVHAEEPVEDGHLRADLQLLAREVVEVPPVRQLRAGTGQHD